MATMAKIGRAAPPVLRDMEPSIAALLDRKALNRDKPAYRPRTDQDVAEALDRFFATAAPGSRTTGVRRMGGGASKEQFIFNLEGGSADGRYVLRMDPLGAVVETDRRREYEALAAFAGTVPAPRAAWLDPDGTRFGQPAAIMAFVDGVTKPSDPSGRIMVSGLGTVLGERWRGILGPQFIDHLVAIHGFDWRNADLPSFEVPDADPHQAARWQANWWSRVWDEDKITGMPIGALTERWLIENLPETRELVFTHADYRTGNYLFDETSGRITALLDWELAHIGDYHEDLGWIVQRMFGSSDKGRFYVSGLFEREEFLDRYEAASGRSVDRKALRFYEVIAAFKCLAITLATGVRVAMAEHNHQDILLTWLATAGYVFQSEICDLLEKDVRA